jgi:predicted nuclease with TOPRIM domain
MKLSKTVQWILTLVILVALICGAVIMFNRQRVIQGDLEAQLTQARLEYTKYKAQRSDLEGRLNRARTDLSQLQEKFHLPSESVEITDAIFEAADDSNVYITRITSSLPKEEKAKKGKVIAYDSFTLTIEAEGDVVPSLLKFSDALSAAFPEGTVKKVAVDADKGEITVDLILYAHKGV